MRVSISGSPSSSVIVMVTVEVDVPSAGSSVGEAVTRNAGGPVGAWLADVLLYLFGISAYWLVALGAVAVGVAASTVTPRAVIAASTAD